MCNFKAQQIEQLVSALRSWSAADARIRGLALVGSWARGSAAPESDVDVVCLVAEPDRFRRDPSWMSAIEWSVAGLERGHWSDADYGKACSRHLKFDGGAEVEMSFVPEIWASVEPIEPATRRVAGDGMRILHDPDGLLQRLVTVL